MGWIIAALSLYIVQIVAVVVIEYRRPYKAVTWLVVLFMLPLVGFLLYYFVAKEYPCFGPARRKESDALEQTKELLTLRCKERLEHSGASRRTVWKENRVHRLLNASASIPVTCGNDTTVYAEGEEAFHAMLESIASAKHHIHIEFFIVRDDGLGGRIQRLLIQKAQEGVKVRFLYDGIGCRGLRKRYLKTLQAAGVEVGCFFPPLATFIDKRVNYRNHRKIIVVDGKVGYFGGLNIGDEYLGHDPKIGHWRDTHFKVRGDAVLWIQYTFLTDWFLTKGQALTDPLYFPAADVFGNELTQIVKSGPDEPMLELIFSFIVSAQKCIYIETPYFIPDAGVLLAIKTAAMSGVDVRVIIPESPDYMLVYYASLSFVEELLQAGVRFYRYQKGFLHAKVVIVDDLAFSGTANMDIRSFCGQFEMNAVFYDGKVVHRLTQDFYSDLRDSKEIILSEFKNRPRLQKVKEVFARLLSPLF